MFKKTVWGIPAPVEAVEEEEPQEGSRPETTQEENDVFNIVKAIMSKVVDPARIYMRDQQSYCGILLDNKNNRPVCQRLETMGGKVNKALSFLGLGAGGLALGDVAKDIALAAVRYDTLGIATTQA